MCGICGAVWTNPDRSLSGEHLAAMMDRMVHRGPDDAGTYRANHVALGFRRLSIVDLAGGHQPLSNEDGTVWTVFNGEIYNFPALRHRLEAKGLCRRVRSLEDRRVVNIELTDEGRAAALQVPEILSRVQNEHLAGFSEAEWEQLKSYLRRILDNAQALAARGEKK
jgi:asparagine synthase (glutamine-hydrolysing)